MTTIGFREWMRCIVSESLHPELHSIISSEPGQGIRSSKQIAITKKIKDLHERGEDTGIAGNTPKGSSRLYLPHREPHKVTLDGKEVHLETGTKVVIRSTLDQYHNKAKHDGMSVGAIQNHAENADHFVNNTYRTIVKDHTTNEYHSNKEMGIFPPIIDHDHKNHEWSHIGHAANISGKEFQDLTKTDTHPQGIRHKDFYAALMRNYKQHNGTHWNHGEREEAHLDHVSQHPLVQKFIDHQDNTGFPPHDWSGLRNMGKWKHPDGSEHIVARDHGFDANAMKVYADARKNNADKVRMNTRHIARARTFNTAERT
jgi:hypothetical protein